MTTGQVLTAVKRISERDNDEYDSDAIESGEKMPMRDQMSHAQGELSLGDPKVTSLSFDLCFLINSSL